MATNRKRFQQRFFSAKTCRIAIFWPKNQKKSLFLEKKLKNVCRFKKKPYLCTRFETQTTSRTKKRHTGALVQLVRIHACHAWGHGFESRTHRNRNRKVSVFVFIYIRPVPPGSGFFASKAATPITSPARIVNRNLSVSVLLLSQGYKKEAGQTKRTKQNH